MVADLDGGLRPHPVIPAKAGIQCIGQEWGGNGGGLGRRFAASFRYSRESGNPEFRAKRNGLLRLGPVDSRFRGNDGEGGGGMGVVWGWRRTETRESTAERLT